MHVYRWKKEVMEKEFQRERWLAAGHPHPHNWQQMTLSSPQAPSQVSRLNFARRTPQIYQVRFLLSPLYTPYLLFPSP